jgi:hypothetical protein
MICKIEFVPEGFNKKNHILDDLGAICAVIIRLQGIPVPGNISQKILAYEYPDVIASPEVFVRPEYRIALIWPAFIIKIEPHRRNHELKFLVEMRIRCGGIPADNKLRIKQPELYRLDSEYLEF